MPVLFFFRALRLFLTGNDQLVVVQADLDIFLVHAGSSAVTSRASFVSATLIAGAPAPMSGEDEFRSKARNAFAISRRMARNASGVSSWLLVHNLGRLICSIHRRLEKISKATLASPAMSALIQLKIAELLRGGKLIF